eukprot:2018969-Rhodomonas_salina.2
MPLHPAPHKTPHLSAARHATLASRMPSPYQIQGLHQPRDGPCALVLPRKLWRRRVLARVGDLALERAPEDIGPLRQEHHAPDPEVQLRNHAPLVGLQVPQPPEPRARSAAFGDACRECARASAQVSSGTAEGERGGHLM